MGFRVGKINQTRKKYTLIKVDVKYNLEAIAKNSEIQSNVEKLRIYCKNHSQAKLYSFRRLIA